MGLGVGVGGRSGGRQTGTGRRAAGQGDWNWPMQASCCGTRAALVRSGLLQLRREEGCVRWSWLRARAAKCGEADDARDPESRAVEELLARGA